MKDFIYILKNSVISTLIVLASLIISLSNFYHVNLIDSLVLLKKLDFYSWVYCFELILITIVSFELYKLCKDFVLHQYYLLLTFILLLFVIALMFLQFDLMIKFIIILFLLVNMGKLIYDLLK